MAAIALLGLVCGLLWSCASSEPEEPFVVVSESYVQYEPERLRKGFYGKTESGLILVTPGYVEWAEGLAVDLEEAQKKLEQERISKLAPGAK